MLCAGCARHPLCRWIWRMLSPESGELNPAGGNAKQIEFRVIIEGGSKLSIAASRRDLPHWPEGLTNAFRHSGASHIDMELIYGTRDFRLVVRDDGCGIDPHILRTGRDGHWGLSECASGPSGWAPGFTSSASRPPGRSSSSRSPAASHFKINRLAASAGGVTEAGDRTGRQAVRRRRRETPLEPRDSAAHSGPPAPGMRYTGAPTEQRAAASR